MKNLITCNICKVRYEATKEYCPVCNSIEYDSKGKVVRAPSKIENNDIHWKKIILVFFGITLFLPCLLFLYWDWSNNAQFSWSLLVILSLSVSWVFLLCFITLYNKPIILGTLVFLITIGFLFLLNLLTHSNWFIKLGMPLAIVNFIFITLMLITLKLIKRKSFNIIAIILIFLLLNLLLTDALINLYHNDVISFSWSILVMGFCLPVIIGLFYLDKHRELLSRWLHF